MAVFSGGNVSLNLGVLQLSGEFSDADRQCAWELYTKLRTRGALHAHSTTEKELMSEVPDSLYAFLVKRAVL